MTQDGSTGQVWLDYSDEAPLPAKRSRFVLELPGADKVVLQTQTVSRVTERYHDPTIPIWVHEFILVDPLTALNDQPLPDLRPMVNTTCGAIFGAVLPLMDPTLSLLLAPGNTVAAMNFHEFSTFGDLRKSELAGGGYVLRMEGGLQVRGDFDDNMIPQSDWQISQNDDRYTPHRFKIDPPEALVSSVVVTPTKEIPLARYTEVHELDGRVMPNVPLEAKPFGLEDSEPFKLTTGQDISDPKLWESTGSIVMSGSHILVNGSLTNLDARPFVFPFQTSWTGIIPDGGTGYQFGYKDGDGNWIWSVSSADYGLELFAGDDQHTYEIFTLTKSGGIEIWGVHLHENFAVDDEAVIATVVSVDYETNAILLSAPWLIDNTYVRIVNQDDDTERGRVRILRRSGTLLICEELPREIQPGDPVTRGVAADSVVTITKIKDVSVSGSYGLPAISGSGIHLGAMIIQRTGQIEGYLLSEHNSMPDQTYPRALKLDIDATQFSDGVVTGSGSSAQVTFSRKFSTDPQILTVFNYVLGGKRDFKSTCGVGGINLTVPLDNEQDPAVLQAFADRLCALGSTNHPHVTSDMQSTEILGIPLPFDALPLDVPAPYRVDVSAVPMLSTKLTLVGSTQGSLIDEDVFMFNMEAGDKPPLDLAKEQALRGTILSKYPIRVASIGGPRIESISWDDVTLAASVSGAGTIYGPMGQALALGSGIDPAAEAGVADPNAGPMILRCTTNTGHSVPDVIIFQLIYPPKPVVQEAVTCHYNAKTNLVTYHWQRPSGGIAFDIQRRLDPDGDGNYDFLNIARQTSNDLALPYEPNSRSIKVRSVGLCDKVSGPYVELDCILPPLPAPSLFDVVKVRANDIVVFRVSAPPTGPQITGRAKLLRVLVRQTVDGDPPVTVRADFPADDDSVAVYDFTPPPGGGVWRVRVPFEDTEADDIVNVAACWVDGFLDESDITTPFDATRPPMTPPSIQVIDFFQSAPQVSGGVIEDDNELVPQVQFSGKFRCHLGRHNQSLQLSFDESDAVTDTSVGPFTSTNRLKEGWNDVDDAEAVLGYIDYEMNQKFRWHKRKQRTCRPALLKAQGPKIREQIGPASEEQATRETLYTRGYVGSPPPLEPHVTDAVFDMVPFYFKPGIGGLLNNFDTLSNVQILQKSDGFIFRWGKLDNPNTARYVLLIHTSPYGTKGPGMDAFIDADLDSIPSGAKQITVYEPTNTTRNVVVWAMDVGIIGKYRFHNGDIVGDGLPGAITITIGTAYYVSVLAQKSNGRWSTNFSPVLNSISGDVVGGAATPGALSFPSGLTANTVDGDPEKNQARIELTFTSASGSFATNNISGVGFEMFQRNESNSANDPSPGTPITKEFNLLDTELAGSTATRLFFFKFGRRYRIVRVFAINGDKRTETTGTLDFLAGGIRSVDPGDSKIVPFPTFGTIARVDGSNKLDRVPVTLTQDGVDIIHFKRLVLESSINGGVFDVEKEQPLRTIDALHASVTGTVTFNFSVKRKAGVSAQYRAYAIAVGGKSSAITTSGSQGATTADVVPDASAPTSLSTPLLIPKPELVVAKRMHADANNISFQKTEVVFKVVDNAAALVGYINPDTGASAGSEAAAKIDIGQSGHYNLRVTAAQLLAAFGGPSNRNVRVYYFVTNGLGTSGASLDSASLPFSSIGTDLVSQDATFPTSLNTPTLVPKKEGLILVKGMRATANNNTMLYDELVLKVVNNAGTLIGYIDPNSVNGADAAVSEAAAHLQVADAQTHPHKVRVEDLITVWGGPSDRNLRAYYYATNARATNPTPSSDSASLAFSSLGLDGVLADSAAPDAPALTVKEYVGSVVVTADAPANNTSTIKKYQIVLSDLNSAPPATDPPNVVAINGVLAYENTRAGTVEFVQPRQEKARWYFGRCLNKNGWGSWSPSVATGQTARPLEDVIGTGVVTLLRPDGDATAPNGFTTSALSVASGHKVCVHVWADENVSGSGNLDTAVIEVILPTDANACSIRFVELTVKRVSNGVTRDFQTIRPGQTCVFRTKIVSAAFSASIRIQNLWRGTTLSPSDGWSAPSDWFALPTASSGTPTYDPGTNAPPANDFEGLSSYPQRYIPL